MRIWKRNAVVVTVILFVCVALYLSWSYNREEDAGLLDPGAYTDVENSGSVVDGRYIVGPNAETGAETGTEDDGSDVAAGEDDYFSAARLTRQKARDTALEILNSAADRETADQTVRDNANREIEALTKSIMAEARIEGLVIAKGFTDCVAYISPEEVSIVVASPVGGLLASDVVKITDIVVNETKRPAADVHVLGTKV